MNLGLEGKVVVVTGGGSNIGRAISLAFAHEKANVVIGEIDEKQGSKVAMEARNNGGSVLVVRTDVIKLADVENLIGTTMENYKKIDVLVNNVGFDSIQPFVSTKADFWHTIVEINYKSVLNTVKTVLPIMINQGFGVIINIGSDAGRVGERYEAVYSGAKGAVISFSKAIAREVGRHGIRINVVCPGGTVPENSDEIGEKSMWVGGLTTREQLEKSKKFYPLGRLGKPDDVAAAVVFLASERAGFITGQTLSVSGGYSMM